MKRTRHTDDDIRDELRRAVEHAGSLRKLADEIGVSHNHVSHVLRYGVPPGPKIAKHFGYREDGLRWVKGD